MAHPPIQQKGPGAINAGSPCSDTSKADSRLRTPHGKARLDQEVCQPPACIHDGLKGPSGAAPAYLGEATTPPECFPYLIEDRGMGGWRNSRSHLASRR